MNDRGRCIHPRLRSVTGSAWAVPIAVALLSLSCTRDDTPRLPADLDLKASNVVIVGLDTVRADHLGAYGSKTVETPHLDAFANEAILFERCGAPSTVTLPSFASLFTGLLPYHHGAVGGPKSRLEPKATTLAEILRMQGYTTHAFVAVDYLTSAFSLDRGFDEHRSFVQGPVSTRSELYQQELLEFLRRPHEKPFLLFAHYFDAHSPYEPPPPYDRMYYEGDPYSPEHPGFRLPSGPNTPPIYEWLRGVTDIEFPIKQYAAAITHLDHSVGVLIDALRESGLMDRSIVVVMADHGEHLTEHDLRFYHRFPYEEVLHVPLMIRLPGGMEGGRRVQQDVSLVDVFPTLSELLGLPLDRSMDGVSLVGLIRGEAPPAERFLFSEFGSHTDRWMKAIWDERYRLMSFNLNGRRWMELYDRKRNPSETWNLVDELPHERKRLARALDARFPPGSRIRPYRTRGAREIAPEVRRRLRALGYEE